MSPRCTPHGWPSSPLGAPSIPSCGWSSRCSPVSRRCTPSASPRAAVPPCTRPTRWSSTTRPPTGLLPCACSKRWSDACSSCTARITSRRAGRAREAGGARLGSDRRRHSSRAWPYTGGGCSMSPSRTMSPTSSAHLVPAPDRRPFSSLPRPRGRELSGPELEAFVADLADRPELWIHLVKHDSCQRVYEELLSDDHVTVWLICWMDNHDTGFHDHDVSAGAVAVVSGAVREERLAIGGPPRDRVFAAGRTFQDRKR